jgi:RHS repeat-associated protein
VSQPDGEITTCAYRFDGLRYSKEDSEGTTAFIWDSENYLAETDDQNEIQAVYTNEPRQYGNLISQYRKDGAIWTPSYYQYDALSSTRALTDDAGDAADTYVCDAWGNEIAVSGSTVNPFRWVGRVGYYWDEGSGTFYIRARMYEPVVGRWMSQDPLCYPAVNPQGKQRGGRHAPFAYSRDNPILFADPTGKQVFPPVFRPCYSQYRPIDHCDRAKLARAKQVLRRRLPLISHAISNAIAGRDLETSDCLDHWFGTEDLGSPDFSLMLKLMRAFDNLARCLERVPVICSPFRADWKGRVATTREYLWHGPEDDWWIVFYSGYWDEPVGTRIKYFLHELTHACLKTKDIGYYYHRGKSDVPDDPPMYELGSREFSLGHTTAWRNADTYVGFMRCLQLREVIK